jgi:hypothetical protein
MITALEVHAGGVTFGRTGRVGVALVYVSVSVIGGSPCGAAIARPVHPWLTVAPKYRRRRTAAAGKEPKMSGRIRLLWTDC